MNALNIWSSMMFIKQAIIALDISLCIDATCNVNNTTEQNIWDHADNFIHTGKIEHENTSGLDGSS